MFLETKMAATTEQNDPVKVAKERQCIFPSERNIRARKYQLILALLSL
jgi:hypothetical protein